MSDGEFGSVAPIVSIVVFVPSVSAEPVAIAVGADLRPTGAVRCHQSARMYIPYGGGANMQVTQKAVIHAPSLAWRTGDGGLLRAPGRVWPPSIGGAECTSRSLVFALPLKQLRMPIGGQNQGTSGGFTVGLNGYGEAPGGPQGGTKGSRAP